jgi:hypothetical protein
MTKIVVAGKYWPSETAFFSKLFSLIHQDAPLPDGLSFQKPQPVAFEMRFLAQLGSPFLFEARSQPRDCPRLLTPKYVCGPLCTVADTSSRESFQLMNDASHYTYMAQDVENGDDVI